MVTITAPGVEINELDLSFYDFPAPKEETLNVLITGFSTKGHTRTPYTFTNKNSDSDLINTFGVPTNEAERYFFNACSEVIKREKTILYAVRLPYNNDSTTSYNYAEYELNTAEKIGSNAKFSIITDSDDTLKEEYYQEIKSKDTALNTDATTVELYRTGQRKPNLNHFIIIDKNQEIYEKIPVDASHMTLKSRYLIGTLPIVTTATNAMYYQKLIENSDTNLSDFEPTKTLYSNGAETGIDKDLLVNPASSLGLPDGNKDALTLSKYAMGYFPTVNIAPNGTFARDRLKNIGIVVFRGYIDAEAGNKISYEPVEAFAGSLKSDDVDPTTGKSRFIDDIVNTNSKTIEFFSNCFNTSTVKSTEKYKAAKFQYADETSDYYVGIATVNPTTVGKTGGPNSLTIEGKDDYTSKVGDIAAYTISDVKHYYTLTKKEDATGKKSDKETWTEITGSIATVSFGYEPEINKVVDVEAKNESGTKLLTVVPEVEQIIKFVKDGKTTYYICTYSEEINKVQDYTDVALLHINLQTSQVLGFTELAASDKRISVNQIYSSFDKIFEKNKDRNEKQIDLVVDAGVANIAQFMWTVNGNMDINTEVAPGKMNPKWLYCYDPIAYQEEGSVTHSAVELWDICTRVGSGSASTPKYQATDAWKLILQKYDAFCKLRGDCMFIADGLRPLCICGNRKRVTKMNFDSTVAKTINPFMKYITGKIDTSYGCGNCDWYQIVDPTSGVNMWMPPSVKMMCSMLDTTNAKYYWTVPVGVNNGKMNPIDNPSKVKVIDIAFSPTTRDAGDIYTKSWNYATYYEDDGFCLEGQRTFLTRPTAFDRINVRRLFLYLERKTYNAAKYFIYEGNTAYTRQRLVDAITPFFEDAKINEGLYDYRIQCDDKNNTPDTIDRNELHVKIAIQPTKAIEFIECTFVALRTGASFTEAGMND